MNVKFNWDGILIFPNTFVDLPNEMETELQQHLIGNGDPPSTLRRLGKAQALRVDIYIYILPYMHSCSSIIIF